jgi:hypothetical protein
MFDPNKYDTDDVQTIDNNSLNDTNDFIEERNSLIAYLKDKKQVILKECAMMEAYIKKNPNSNAAKHFEEKLKGWSKILVGLDIVINKYNI